jgi:hypothetical protein
MKKHLIKSFWTLPDVDAKVAIYIHPEDEALTVITFLAKGYASRMVDGQKKLMPRNPDRLKLVEYLLPLLPPAQAVRYGKKSNLPDVSPQKVGVRKLYSKGGNFQFDVVVSTGAFNDYFCPDATEGKHSASNWFQLERTTGKAIKALDLDLLLGLLSTVVELQKGELESDEYGWLQCKECGGMGHTIGFEGPKKIKYPCESCEGVA